MKGKIMKQNNKPNSSLPTTRYLLSSNRYSLNKDSKIVVFGSSGLVGSAIVRKLIEKGYKDIIGTYNHRLPTTRYPLLSTSYSLPTIRYYKIDLLNNVAVREFFEEHKPEFVFLAAAKVGGIVANNTYRADFIYENLQIQNNVIYNAYKYGVKKLLFLGSTCIYPKECPQPIKEEYLLTGPLEYTNEPYAIAKIAGIKMCESFNLQYGTNFISVMPTNLYGPNDNFDLEKSHVLPALIRKMHLGKCLEEDNWEAIRKDLNKNPIEGIDGSATKEEILAILEKYGIKIQQVASSKQKLASSKEQVESSIPTTHYPLHSVSIEIWGSGKPMREFLYSYDMADACVFIMERIDFKDLIQDKKEIRNTHINIGTGKEISIKELAELIKDIVGFRGDLYFNTQKPDGTMRKLTDVTKLHFLGWRPKVELREGIEAILRTLKEK
jgi:GDP-L-fucose synthase